jgi:hypothetical protein
MALHPAEEATIRAFVTSARRDRLVALLANPKRRRKALNSLDHFHDWDPRWVQALASGAHAVRILRAAGAPDSCHVISGDEGLDGRDMPLADAVAAADAYDFASILSCVPGELALFFDESAAPRPVAVLRRPPRERGS